MREIPKIVREHLKAGPVRLTHPDADVLTAFSERSLPERERATVLEHLSGCADCREIVALALPATEPVRHLPQARSMGLSWPVFRWGFAFAGLMAIAVFGLVQYRHYSHQTMAYFKAPASAHLEAKTEPLPQPRAEDKAVLRQDSKLAASERDAQKSGVATNLGVSPSAPSPSTKQSFVLNGSARSRNALPHGPLQSNQWQQQNALTNQAANAAPGVPAANGLDGKAAGAAPAPTPPTVTVQSAAPAIDTRAQDLGGLVLKNQSVADLQPQGGHAEAEVEKTKQPALGGPRKIVAQTDQLAVYEYAAGLPTNTPRWSINSTGTLQRSFDQGVTWQNVNVTNSPAAGGAAFAVASAPARAKEPKENESLKKSKKDELSPPVFRTVAANGLDVWAGGANGLLYHSTDAGAHWIRVVPAAGGAVLTGDVLTMEFPDPHQGKIVTSTGETWSTTDGGMSWQKQ